MSIDEFLRPDYQGKIALRLLEAQKWLLELQAATCARGRLFTAEEFSRINTVSAMLQSTLQAAAGTARQLEENIKAYRYVAVRED